MLAGSDSLPGQYQQPQGFHILVNIADTREAERIFNALAENGTVAMPFQKTFWAAGFGVLNDQFGISWEINAEQ
jgi:PhnB protein